LELIQGYKIELKDYEGKLKDYNKQWEGFGKTFGEQHEKETEKYLLQLEKIELQQSVQPREFEFRKGEDIIIHNDRRVNPDRNELFRHEDYGRVLDRDILKGQMHIAPHGDGDNVLFVARQREPFGRITSAMERDGLIDRDGEYNIVLEEDKLKVNGKRMPDEVHQKYLEIFEKSQGYKVEGKTKIEIAGKT
jgi:hypothetical protein